MGFSGGDVERMHAAAAALRPVVSSVDGQASAISQAARAAAAAAGNPAVAAAVTACLDALARAAGDTGLVVGQLGNVARVTADNLNTATRAR